MLRRSAALLTLMGLGTVCTRHSSSSTDAGAVARGDYASLVEVSRDGTSAIGHTLFFKARRGGIDPTSVILVDCEETDGGVGRGALVKATYSREKRPLAKAIPITNPCARVRVMLTGLSFADSFEGEVVQILDVTPAAAQTLPLGVDYVSLDDINVDRENAAGKIANLRVYRGSMHADEFVAFPCDGVLDWLEVGFSPAQEDVVSHLSTRRDECQTINIELTTWQRLKHVWKARLKEVLRKASEEVR